MRRRRWPLGYGVAAPRLWACELTVRALRRVLALIFGRDFILRARLYPLAAVRKIVAARLAGPAFVVFEMRRRRWPLGYGVAAPRSGSRATVRGRVHHLAHPLARARRVMMAGAGGAMRATGWRATAIRFQQFGEGGPRSPSLSPTRAREALMMAGAGGAMRATGWRATAIRFQQFGEGGPRSPSLSPTRAREALMMAGAGGAMRATGWRATAIRFQQFGEGGSYGIAR